MRHSNRVSACRRELSSHEAASPQTSARVDALQRLQGNAPRHASLQCPKRALKSVKPKEWVRQWLFEEAARFGYDA